VFCNVDAEICVRRTVVCEDKDQWLKVGACKMKHKSKCVRIMRQMMKRNGNKFRYLEVRCCYITN
jgi:hypothetical protein